MITDFVSKMHCSASQTTDCTYSTTYVFRYIIEGSHSFRGQLLSEKKETKNCLDFPLNSKSFTLGKMYANSLFRVKRVATLISKPIKNVRIVLDIVHVHRSKN